MQEKGNPSALAMELPISCINPSIYDAVTGPWNVIRNYVRVSNLRVSIGKNENDIFTGV